MVAPHEREVIIRLILQPDKAGGAQALAEIRKITDGAKTQATAATKAVTTATERAADQQVKAVKKVAAEQDKAMRAMRQNQAAMANAFKQSASGALLLGRSLAMLGALGQKDLEKVLRALVKIQMVYDSLRGAAQMIHGMAQAWRAYQVAVAGAAAAQATLAATSGVGAVAGGAAGGAVVGGAARGAAGGLGKAAVGGVAAGVGVKVAGGVGAAGLGTFTLAVAAAAASLAALTSIVTTGWEAIKYGPGKGAAPGTYPDVVGGKIAGVGAWLSGKMPEGLRGAIGVDPNVERLRISGEKAAAEEARLGRKHGREAVELEHAERMAGLRQQERTMKQAMFMEDLQGILKVQRAQSQAAQQRFNQLERIRDISTAARDQAQAQATGAMERFARLSPHAAMRVQRAKQKMAAGQRLTIGEEEALAQFREIPSVGTGLHGGWRQRAEKRGWEGFGGRELGEITKGHEDLVRRIEVDLSRQKVQVEIKSENAEALAAYIASRITRQQEQFWKRVQQEIVRQIERAEERRESQLSALGRPH